MTTPQPINVAILGTATTLYTAFIGGGATRAMLVSLNLANTTVSDITVNVWYENAAGSTLVYLDKPITVPALGSAWWKGMAVINTISDKWRAQASAVGVDCTGTVMENA